MTDTTASPATKGVHHLGLTVPDVEKAAARNRRRHPGIRPGTGRRDPVSPPDMHDPGWYPA